MIPHHPPQTVVADTPDSFEDPKFLLGKMIEIIENEKEVIKNVDEKSRKQLIDDLYMLQVNPRSYLCRRRVNQELIRLRHRLVITSGVEGEAYRSIANIQEVFNETFPA